MARTVGGLIAAHPDMAVAAVGSRDLARAQALAADLGSPAAHGSYRALVEDPAVQAVYVTTPHPQHAEVVEIALLAGKAVLCEKPLTHRLDETERLVALARSTGTFLMEALWTRFNPLVQHLLEQRESLGELRSVHASLGFVAPDDPSSRLWDPALGGGALLDLAVYTVSFARMVLGEPTGLAVTGSLGSTGVDAEEVLHLTFPGGAQAVLESSLLTTVPRRGTVIGTKGFAELTPSFHAPTHLRLERAGAPVEELEIPDRTAGYVGELEEVLRCVREGRSESPLLPLSDALATMRLLEQARDELLAQQRG